MIYLIGGAPRTGKSRLADTMLRELGCAPLHTDLTVQSIGYASSRLLVTSKLHPKFDMKTRTKTILPILLRQTRDMSLLHENVVVEGELISPRNVSAFQKMFGQNNVRAVFLVASRPNIAKIIEHEGRAGWVASLDPEQHQLYETWFTNRASTCIKDAKKHGQRVIDISAGYQRAIAAAFRHLTGKPLGIDLSN